MPKDKMKTSNKILQALIATGLVLATSASMSAFAATHEGKGASLLMPAPKAVTTQIQDATASAEAGHLSCAQCRDVPVVVVDHLSKASQHEKRTTTMAHQCSACETKITTSGHGKAKTDKAAHTCGWGKRNPVAELNKAKNP